MIKQEEKQFQELFEKQLEQARMAGLKAGSTGMLGAVLNLCNERGKTITDIKKFCETMLGVQNGK